jgi:hypothetical protein
VVRQLLVVLSQQQVLALAAVHCVLESVVQEVVCASALGFTPPAHAQHYAKMCQKTALQHAEQTAINALN